MIRYQKLLNEAIHRAESAALLSVEVHTAVYTRLRICTTGPKFTDIVLRFILRYVM